MPRPFPLAPPAAELRAAYAVAGLIPLARRYRVAPLTVRRWLVAAGIEVRPTRTFPATGPLPNLSPPVRPQPPAAGRLTLAERDLLRERNLTVMPLATRLRIRQDEARQLLSGRQVAGDLLARVRALLAG